MIRETLTPKNNPALTSDCWHIIHARWSGKSVDEPRFVRTIVSEHSDRPAAVEAARAIHASLVPGMAARAPATRDQILVRRPSRATLKTGKRVQRRRQ